MTTESALRQFKRLEVFRPKRMPTEAVLEYLEAIKTAKDERIAKEAIGNLCRYGERFPCPGEIVTAIVNLQERGYEQSRKSCSVCGGTGYVSVERPYEGKNRTLQELYNSVPIQSTIQVSRTASQVTTKSSLAKIDEIDIEKYQRIDEQSREIAGPLCDDAK
jgi:hypothetical protein